MELIVLRYDIMKEALLRRAVKTKIIDEFTEALNAFLTKEKN